MTPIHNDVAKVITIAASFPQMAILSDLPPRVIVSQTTVAAR
jgi:hypothetical protein